MSGVQGVVKDRLREGWKDPHRLSILKRPDKVMDKAAAGHAHRELESYSSPSSMCACSQLGGVACGGGADLVSSMCWSITSSLLT